MSFGGRRQGAPDTMPPPPIVNSLYIEVLAVPTRSNPNAFEIATRPVVDGQHVLKFDDIVFLTELIASCDAEGVRHLFSCTCGVPECGGYYEGVDVRHVGGCVLWTNRDRHWSATYQFNREAYRDAIDDAIARVRVALAAEGSFRFQTRLDVRLFPDWIAESEPTEIERRGSNGPWGFRRRKAAR